jgi:mono/diheme cytochrome c family protein
MRAITRAIVIFILPLLVIGLVACGADDSSVASQAEEAVSDVQTGTVTDESPDEGEGHTEVVADEHDDGDAHEDDGNAHQAGADLVTTGEQLFVEKGCSACHGVDGVGTDFAPAMPGHTELQVRRQVRGPIGIMSVFGPEAISSAELDALVDYVTSLSGGHAHGDGSANPTSDELLGHHLMAITALEGDNTTEAQHHIEHILGIVDGEHLVLMQHADELASDGETHEAQHLIEAMVADVTTPDEDLGTLHLKLALSSLRVGDSDGADHHLDHALGSGGIHDSSEVLEILGLIDSTDLEEAEGHLSVLVGVDAIGVEAGSDGHDDDEATHDEAEAGHDDDEAAHDEAEAVQDDDEAVQDDDEAVQDDAEAAHDDDEAVQDDDAHDDAEAENDDDHHDDDASGA